MEDDYDVEESYELVEGSPFDFHSPQDILPDNSPLGRLAKVAGLPDAEIDLAEAALMVSAQQYPGLNEAYYMDWLDALADEVRPLIATETDPLKNIAHLNHFLTTLKGFHGNETDYNNRRNSYLSDVLEKRTGLPITLSLLYIELGKRLGLHFEGIGLPGHFIIRYRELAPQAQGRSEWASTSLDGLGRLEETEPGANSGNGEILLDPFNGGTILTEEDCIELVREKAGRTLPVRAWFRRPVTNRQFLVRLLNNLKASLIGENDFEQALQVQECLILLTPLAVEEKRDRGMLYLREGRYGRAITDLQTYLREAPDARDAEPLRRHLKVAFDKMVARN